MASPVAHVTELWRSEWWDFHVLVVPPPPPAWRPTPRDAPTREPPHPARRPTSRDALSRSSCLSYRIIHDDTRRFFLCVFSAITSLGAHMASKPSLVSLFETSSLAIIGTLFFFFIIRFSQHGRTRKQNKKRFSFWYYNWTTQAVKPKLTARKASDFWVPRAQKQLYVKLKSRPSPNYRPWNPLKFLDRSKPLPFNPVSNWFPK
jgi:hypothetical protein